MNLQSRLPALNSLTCTCLEMIPTVCTSSSCALLAQSHLIAASGMMAIASGGSLAIKLLTTARRNVTAKRHARLPGSDDCPRAVTALFPLSVPHVSSHVASSWSIPHLRGPYITANPGLLVQASRSQLSHPQHRPQCTHSPQPRRSPHHR
jgi:hypothetical protein